MIIEIRLAIIHAWSNKATNGFTITISGESAILSQRQDGEVVPIYLETPESGRTSVGDVDSQLMSGREMALEQGTSLGIIYTDRIKAVEAKNALLGDPDNAIPDSGDIERVIALGQLLDLSHTMP